MKYNELILTSHNQAQRVGRGIASGGGKTAGRGTKGQGARKSGNVRIGFEGGQTPLAMRLPKLKGFKSHRSKAEVVYTGQINDLKKTLIDSHVLFEAGLISSPYLKVKLLFKGDITSKKDIKLFSASDGAAKAVAKAGGSFQLVERLARPSKNVAKTKTE